MSQIINIHVGGCGVKVGLKFWKIIQSERKSNEKENQNHNNYYDKFYFESQEGIKKPRALFFDTDIRSNFLASQQSQIRFDPYLVYAYGSSCRNLYSQGKYGFGKQIQESLTQLIRNEVQKCDILGGFMLTRSPTGGAGSGLGQNIITNISQEFSQTIIQQFKIMPGLDNNSTYKNLSPLEAYNTVLCNSCTIENSSLVYIFQNTKIEQILQRNQDKKFSMNSINQYIALCLNRHVKAYIQSGIINTNPRKRAVNLVPYPRVKHLCGSLSQNDQKDYVRSALNFQNRLIRNSMKHDDRIYTIQIDVSGQTESEQTVWNVVSNWTKSSNNKFVEWIANPLHVSIRSWVLYNGNANIQWAKKINEILPKLLRKKQYFHHYTQLGMDQMQFFQSQSAFNDFISEYVVYDYHCTESNELSQQSQQY